MSIFDIAIIGSGPAGEKAALEAASLGASVVVIEKGFKPGGASVITGTIPSKSLRETVQFVCSMCRPDLSGVELEWDRQPTIKELMHRKQKVISQRTDKILEDYAKAGITYLNGEGRFLSPHEIEVSSETSETNRIEAKKIIVAVGTTPYHPPDIQFDGKVILDSDTVLQLDQIPKSIAIIGGGVIGCEYAFIFSKLGTKVTLIDPRGSLLTFIDAELSGILADILVTNGSKLELGEEYEKIERIDDQVQITLKSGKILRTNLVLYANGRQGLANKLNLSACELTVNSRNQLEVNSNYQTATPHIYAVGDIIGFPSLVSTSNEEGRLAAIHAVTGKNVNRVGSDIPSAIYTIPEVGMVGPTEQELKKNSVPYAVGTCRFDDLAKGQIIGEYEGMLKLIFDPETLRLIAVHILGASAAELVHIGQTVISFQGTIDFFINSVFNFPTLSLAYKVAAREGKARLNEGRNNHKR